MTLAQKTKRQLLATQVALKRRQNNEAQLEKELGRFFRKLKKSVLKELNEYWSDYQLLQGQINLITKPILDAEEEYNQILEKYIRRQYRLGSSEAERIVQNLTDNASMKAIDLQGIRAKIKKRNNQLFGTLRDAEDELLEKTFIASKRTLARVTSQINQIITDGYTSGKGINVVAGMLQKRFDQLETWEAKRIARTEIHNAHNNAVMRTYNNLGVEYTQWISAGDDGRTRETHLGPADGVPDGVDGEIIPMGGTYSNGLQYPGDTSGPIEEWINCRCSNAPFVIPYGFMAPSFSPFRESDLVPINTKSS